MVKAIISGITNTLQKTYRIAQYTDSWNRLHSLFQRAPCQRRCTAAAQLVARHCACLSVVSRAETGSSAWHMPSIILCLLYS